ncbi:MAG: ACT domain-containing protein [Eubacteriales bacterium]|nr:ACT domain-containing protein [Eubacteriales bacterium]
MMIKQISVFVENKKGRLAKITEVLGQAGIDLIALSIADTTNFGIMRCIVSDPDKAISVLKQNGYTASTTEVIVAEVVDEPGGLASVLGVLDSAGISVEYLYSFVRTPNENALILFRVEDIGTAISALRENGVKLLDSGDVYQI